MSEKTGVPGNGYGDGMSLIRFHKVPFRDVYCDTWGAWLRSCFQCAWLTFMYRTGLRRHAPIGGPQ